MTSPAATLDIWVQNEGTIAIFWGRTEAGEAWLEENLDDAATKWGSGIVVEHRFIDDIINGALDAELTVGGS